MEESLQEYRDEVIREWYMFKKVIRKYNWIFADKYIDKELFFNLYGQVCTRCFGYGLPSTTMVPMADNINHTSTSVTNEIVNIAKHVEEDQEDLNYNRVDKVLCNYSTLFKHKGIEGPKHIINGRYNPEIFEKNTKLVSISSAKEHLSKHYMQVWHVPYLYTNLSESNDTSDEEEPTEEDTKAGVPPPLVLNKEDEIVSEF